MNLNFTNIDQHTIPMPDFKLNWRFTDKTYDKLPDQDLDELKPLDENGARFIWNYYMTRANLHEGFPFRKGFFSSVDQRALTDDGEKDIRTWLHEKGIAPSHRVFVSWDPYLAMIVPWNLFRKYFDCFYYTGSDDLTVLDQHLNWALLCHHADSFYFGTKEPFKTN